MRLRIAAMFAVAVAAAASPAAACGVFSCVDAALSDDSYPGAGTPMPAEVQEMVAARHGRGLSLAGFYNDPSLALAERRPVPAAYDYAPPPAPVYAPPPEPAYIPPPAPAMVEAPEPADAPAPVDYGYERRHHGPHVIMSPFGRRHEGGRRVAREREHGPHVY